MTNTQTIVISKAATFKVVQVSDKVLERCAVKAAYVEQLKLDEIEALVNWCNFQSSDLWEDMSLQEILNVYRATAEWINFETWAAEDWEAAYAAWNAAVIDEGNKLEPAMLTMEGGGCCNPMISIRQISREDVTPEMVDVLHKDYLKKHVSARECVIRLLNMHDGLKDNDPGAHKEATSGQIHAINNLFLIKGWSATCTIKRILQELENNRYGGS